MEMVILCKIINIYLANYKKKYDTMKIKIEK